MRQKHEPDVDVARAEDVGLHDRPDNHEARDADDESEDGGLGPALHEHHRCIRNGRNDGLPDAAGDAGRDSQFDDKQNDGDGEDNRACASYSLFLPALRGGNDDNNNDVVITFVPLEHRRGVVVGGGMV